MTNPTMRLASLLLAGALLTPVAASGQWVQQNEQFYLEASHNWVFRNNYQSADRLFNAFDYGHAILYETLWTKPGAPASLLEVTEYDRLTKRILVRPPRVPLEEAAIEPQYVKLAPEAKLMFEWAHVLHRQLYDVLGDERLTEAQKDAEVARVVAYYKTRPDIAFSSRPKTMELMQEQPYSLAFRKRYPKFNGLIWGYHWLQIGLYEPLLAGRSPEERQALIRRTVARFWQMLEQPVAGMPHVMPMTAAVAPRFAARYPEAAIIFDNLHSMHDVISDILANPAVPRDRKRAEILVAAARFRDDTSFVTSEQGWRTMASHMGLENMGGPAVGFPVELPTPTVTYGAVMTHDPVTGEMTGFRYGEAVGGAHAGHGAAPAADTASDEHAGHGTSPADTGAAAQHDSAMTALHVRLLSDPLIRQRIMADTLLHRQMLESLPAAQREHLAHQVHEDSAAARSEAVIPVTKAPAASRARKPAARPAAAAARKTPPKAAARQATQPARKPAPKPVDPHAGHRP